MKNIIRYCLPLLSVFCLANCDKTVQQEERWAGKEFALMAETIRSDRELLNDSPIVIFKNHLVLKSHESDKFFSLFELNGDNIKYINNFLSTGRGPYEVAAAYGHYMQEENMFCMVGYNLYGKNMFVPLDDPNNLFDLGSWRVSENNLTQAAIGLIPISSSFMLVMRAGENNRMFAVMDVDNNTIEDIDVVVPDDIDAPLWEKLASIYQGRMRKRPGHSQFAYSSQQGHIVKVFELTDKQVRNQFDIFDELPKYYYDGNRIRREDKNKRGFSLEVTEKFIYIGDRKLTDAVTADEARRINGYPSGYIKTIYVSDWEGNPVIKYELDRAVAYCSIDQNDEYLYAFAYNAETLVPDLVRFKLPKIEG